MVTPVETGMMSIKHGNFNPSLLDNSNSNSMQRSILIIALCLTAAAMVNLDIQSSMVEKNKIRESKSWVEKDGSQKVHRL